MVKAARSRCVFAAAHNDQGGGVSLSESFGGQDEARVRDGRHGNAAHNVATLEPVQ